MGNDDAVRLLTAGPSHEIWKGPQGAMIVDWTNAGAVRLTVRDYGHAGFAPPVVRRWDEALGRHGKISTVFDFWDLVNYDATFHARLQTWGVFHRKDLRGVFLLSRSSWVSRGAALANLALGGMIRLLSDRPSLDRECERLGLPSRAPEGGS